MRLCYPLETAPLPPLPAGIEVLLLTSLLKAQDGSTFRQTLALVLADPPERLRHEVRALAASFVAARAEIHALPAAADMGPWLRRCVAPRGDDMLPMLVCAASAATQEPSAAGPGCLANVLSEIVPGWFTHKVIVAPERVLGIGRHYGWVQGPVRDALGVVEILATLMSPETAYADDEGGLYFALSARPFRLIRAAWLASENRLHFASQQEAAWLAQSNATVATVQEASAFADYGKVCRLIKQHMPIIEDEVGLIAFTGCGLRVGLGAVGGMLPVPMLVRVPA